MCYRLEYQEIPDFYFYISEIKLNAYKKIGREIIGFVPKRNRFYRLVSSVQAKGKN